MQRGGRQGRRADRQRRHPAQRAGPTRQHVDPLFDRCCSADQAVAEAGIQTTGQPQIDLQQDSPCLGPGPYPIECGGLTGREGCAIPKQTKLASSPAIGV